MSSVTAFSGNVPMNYETYLGPVFFEPYALDLVQRLQEIKPPQTVLEIACGTGRVTNHLASQLPPDTTLVATDLNSDMIALAGKRVSRENLEWQVADAHQLPFAANEFGLVVCQYGIMFFQDKPKALSEIARVLKSGGTFLFNTWDELQYNSLSQMAQTVLEKIYPVDPPRFLEKGPYSLFDTEKITELLQQAGFQNISIEKVAKTGYAGTADDAVNGILDGTPNYGYIMQKNIPLEVVKAKLKAMLIEHFGETDLLLPMQAFVVQARKP